MTPQYKPLITGSSTGLDQSSLGVNWAALQARPSSTKERTDSPRNKNLMITVLPLGLPFPGSLVPILQEFVVHSS